MALDDERKFLHDVANPLGAAIVAVELLGDELQSSESDREVGRALLEKICIALDRIRHTVEERRKKLLADGEMK